MSLGPRSSFYDALLNGLTFVPVDIFATYTMIYLLIPFFLKRRKYYIFIFATILLAFTTILFNKIIHYYIYIPVFYPEWIDKRIFWAGNNWYYLVSTYAVVTFGAGVKLTKMWVKEQQHKIDYENEKIKSELLLLKSQINPHFLFNTLNNIDSLIETNPQKASESIIYLSDLLRYATYETDNDFVPIEKEEECLRSYIGLNILRFGDKLIKYETSLIDKNKLITPMLLIPLVENAIKHGDKKAGLFPIKVNLISNENIIFTVENVLPKEVMKKDSVGGVGITNLRRRLDLLYKDNYRFETKIIDNKYIASLWIQ
jgi:hypothetical protein